MRRYNSPHPMTYWTRQSLITAFVLVCGVSAAAIGFTDAATQFAREIAGATGAGSVSMTVRNASSLTPDRVGEVRRAIEAQLRTDGVRPVAPANAVAEVAVTLSENAQGYLWIAEIRQGNDTRVVMRPVPRPQVATTASPQARVTLSQTLVHSQPQPILDVAIFEAGTPNARVAILDADKVAIYRLGATQGEPLQSLPITHARSWPRDLRGRLLPARDHLFDVWLPGVICTSAVTAPISMNCREGDDPWPLVPSPRPQNAFYGAARNFFTGVMRPGVGKQANVPPFYSAAAFDRGSSTLWVMTNADGKVRQFDGVNEREVAGTGDWGSDLAAVNTGCGTMLLATAGGDDTMPDRIRAYEITDREAAPASAPVEFSGPVTALWAATDDTSANAVVHNLKTDQYEAYSLTLACHQ